jgi:hypothetical protein
MWCIIPLFFLAIFVCIIILNHFTNQDHVAELVVCGMILAISLCICPTTYFQSKTEALQNEQYYNSFVIPNKISEDDNNVIVSSTQAGLWQAGNNNVVSYNNYLVSNRYWKDVPILGWQVYPAPSNLKFVIVK